MAMRIIFLVFSVFLAKVLCDIDVDVFRIDSYEVDLEQEECPINELVKDKGFKYDFRASAFLIQDTNQKEMPLHVNCVIESFLRNNPKYKLFIFAKNWKKIDSANAKIYNRVTVLKTWNYQDLFSVDPKLDKWYSYNDWSDSLTLAEALRLLLLKSCGGTSLSSGIITTRPHSALPINFVASQQEYDEKGDNTILSNSIIRLQPEHPIVKAWIKMFLTLKTKDDMYRGFDDKLMTLSKENKPRKFIDYPNKNKDEKLIRVLNISCFNRVRRAHVHVFFEKLITGVSEIQYDSSGGLYPEYSFGIFIWPHAIRKQLLLKPFHHYHSNTPLLRVFNSTCPSVMKTDRLDGKKNVNPSLYLILDMIEVEFKYPLPGKTVYAIDLKSPELRISFTRTFQKHDELRRMGKTLLEDTVPPENHGKVLFCEKDWAEEDLSLDVLRFNKCYKLIFNEHIPVKLDIPKPGHMAILIQVFAQKAFLQKHLKYLKKDEIFKKAGCFEYISSEQRFVLNTKLPKSKKDKKKLATECFFKIAFPAATSFNVVQ